MRVRIGWFEGLRSRGELSHDRTFLRGLSNRVLELRPGDGNGTPAQPPLLYPGTYVEYVERTGSEAAGVQR